MELFNASGVLMQKNAAYQVGLGGTIYIVLESDPSVEVFHILPGFTTPILNAVTLSPAGSARELVGEAVEDLKKWGVSEDRLSKQLIGQTVLMKALCPTFDRDTFVSVISAELTLKGFMNVLKLSEGGTYDPTLVGVAELSDMYINAMLSPLPEEEEDLPS